MSVKTVGGNIIEVEAPKKPEQPVFGSFVRKPDDVVDPKGAPRLIPQIPAQK